jgi:hypothetical protein
MWSAQTLLQDRNGRLNGEKTNRKQLDRKSDHLRLRLKKALRRRMKKERDTTRIKIIPRGVDQESRFGFVS